MSEDANNSSQSAWLMIQAGLGLFVMGAMAVGLWWLRVEALPAYERDNARVQLLSLADRARGDQPSKIYHQGDWVRVHDFAPAKTTKGAWVGLGKDLVLVVRDVHGSDQGADWLQVSTVGQTDAPPVTLHASFVERYDPVVLAGGLEISDCRLHRYVDAGRAYYSVSGKLRNGTDRAISQCEVLCHLRNSAGEPLAVLRSTPITLAGETFGRFETSPVGGDADVAAFSLSVRYEKAGHAEESPEVLVRLRQMPESSHD